MKRVAVFGGAFDPPHAGHLLVISAVLNSEAVDEVWVVPAGDDRYDKGMHASAEHRKQMLEEMLCSEFKDEPRVRLNTIQLDDSMQGSATIDLLDALAKESPEAELYFLIGADNVSALSSWKRSEELLQKFKFLAVSRLDVTLPDPLPKAVTVIPPVDVATSISSSRLREMISSEEHTAGLMNAEVRAYLDAKKLYRA